MEQQFDAILTGSDSPIEGIVNLINYNGVEQAYAFTAIDNTLHLIIAKDNHGHWVRIAGTDPYFAGWVDELAEQINNQQ
ncbi:hypothetical protein HH214_20755 [Mucilaginibacter robiniae]|uniref:Uncharacterized protein n=1 Tax=Mucilaginibacter robiniae TaxID=2728022 RepID=A0A7L5E523_9SPHI|nr:hypothetical protein [Mucilaginibacter robiniae]QJD98131.1 hypothetical protein HH214_20755 [Mucilaginibacter robiniae]